jgi:hypothetical protein
MSYQEKRTGASILTGALVLAAYCIYAFGKNNTGVAASGDLKFWASTMLIFLGIGIGAAILVQIVFHILFAISVAVQQELQGNQSDDKAIEKMIKLEIREDERDRLIELKSIRLGFITAGLGFVGGLVSLLFNNSPVIMLNILYISFSVGSLLEGVGQLYYYRKGV